MEISNDAVSIKAVNYVNEQLNCRENYHKEAIYYFERKLSQKPKCVSTLCEWIASYHELASMYAEKGEIESAQKCLLIPHQSMLYMAQEHNGDREQEQIAMRAINLTLPPLLAFANDYPPCDNCLKKLQNQLEMIQNNNKTDH